MSIELKTIIAALESHLEGMDAVFEGEEFDDGYAHGVEFAIDVISRWGSESLPLEVNGPSKERLLALSDKMLVLGSPQSSKELLDIAEKFGV